MRVCKRGSHFPFIVTLNIYLVNTDVNITVNRERTQSQSHEHLKIKNNIIGLIKNCLYRPLIFKFCSPSRVSLMINHFILHWWFIYLNSSYKMRQHSENTQLRSQDEIFKLCILSDKESKPQR